MFWPDCDIKIRITVTLSKVFAIALMVAAISLDLHYELQAQLFMWTTPFGVGLIGGKQALDTIKAVKGALTNKD